MSQVPLSLHHGSTLASLLLVDNLAATLRSATHGVPTPCDDLVLQVALNALHAGAFAGVSLCVGPDGHWGFLGCPSTPLHGSTLGAASSRTSTAQTDYGHPYLTDFGQNWCFSLLAFFFKKKKKNNKKKKQSMEEQTPEGWGPEGWGPEGWGPEGWGPKPRKGLRGPTLRAPPPDRPPSDRPPPDHPPPDHPPPDRPNFRSFSSLSHRRFALLVSLWVSSRGIWWCLKRWNPQLCTFGVLGLSCEAPAAAGEGKKARYFGLSGGGWVRQSPNPQPHQHQHRQKWRVEARRSVPEMRGAKGPRRVEAPSPWVWWFRSECWSFGQRGLGSLGSENLAKTLKLAKVGLQSRSTHQNTKIGQSRFGQSRSSPQLAKVGQRAGQSRFEKSRFGQSWP